MKLPKSTGKNEVRLYNFGHQLDGLLQSRDSPFRTACVVEAQAQKVREPRGARFQLESGSIGLNRAPVLVPVAKPGTELDVALGVRLGA
jgi:hypothetical protein